MRVMQLLFQKSTVSIVLLLSVLASFFLMYSCQQSEEVRSDNNQGAFKLARDHAFVGDKSCQSCHAQEWDDWKGSHHDYAIAEADEEAVRGDFENECLIS